MTFERKTLELIIQPVINEKTGIYTITIKLTDSYGAGTSYNANIEVMTEE